MTDDRPDLPNALPNALPDPLPDALADHSEAAPALAPAATVAAPRQRHEGGRRALLAGVAVLALIVVVGGVLLWREGVDSANQLAGLDSRVAGLDRRIAGLQGRMTKLEARPFTDPAPIGKRIDALTQRVGTLENKPPPQATLDQAAQKQFAQLAGRVDAVAARQDEIGTRQQSDAAKTSNQIDQVKQQVEAANNANAGLAAATQKASAGVAAAAARQTQIVRIQAATVALAAGRPLGELPGAPPALARYATKAPPTQAALRLSYDQAAQQALAAGQPEKPGTPFLTRLWNRAQSGIVVREGGRVLVGDSSSDTLEQARRQLDAGDLAGAVGSLGQLTGPAATAMSAWRTEAQSLLDARAALLAMAQG